MTLGLGDKISVCLLTYNHVEVIESTLRSILDQTITGYEVIVSDDCSTDGTWERILELAAEDARIKPLRTPRNMGMPGNANFAVAQSNRDYIALLHHDDLYRKDLLEKWANVLNRHPDVAFVFNPYGVFESDFIYEEPMPDECIDGKWLLERYLFARWGCVVRGTAMIRHAVWERVGGMREQFGLLADIDMWMRLAMRSAVGYVPEPIITVRHHRPSDYPDIYKGGAWSWRRQRFLYEVHASNRLDYLKLNTLLGRLQWWGFRLKLSYETSKWLVYALVRKKREMITASQESVTRYDLWPLRVLRHVLQRIYSPNKTCRADDYQQSELPALCQKQRGPLANRDVIELRAAKVSSVTGLSTLLSVALQLISVPICLKYWGEETYGSWLALYAAFMLVRSLDAGFVSYVGNKLNYLYHQDQDALREHLASSIIGIAIIGTLQLSMVIAAIFSDSIVLLLGVTSGRATDYHSGLALLVLVGTWVLSGSYLGVVHRLMIPTGLMYQAAWWSMGFQISQFVGIVLAAILHFDMLQASQLFAFAQFSIYLASAIYIRYKLPIFYPWWRVMRLRTGIKDLRRSMLLTASSLIQQGATSGTVILVSVLSSPAVVPVFTTVRTLANLWANVTNVLTTPLLPEVVRYHAKGEGRKLEAISETYWVLVGSIVNLGVLITYPLIEPLYGYWTAHAVALDNPLLCLLLASVVLTNVGGLLTLYLNGINSLGVVLAASVVRGILSLGVGGFLFLHFGLAGFGMAILGGELLALLVLGHNFVRCELPRQGVSMPLRSLAPITVSTASVLLFLMSEGFGTLIAPYIYPAALLGVATSGLWGWRRLETGVRTRLVRMIGDRFIRKGVA